MTKEEILTRLTAAYTGPGSVEEGTFAGDVLRACADGMAQLWSMDINGLERRAAVLAAMAGGRTLTPALLKELCVRLGGGERGEVEEDFPHWAVTALAVCRGRMPESTGALARAVERLKPAHLAVAVLPAAELETADGPALHGGVLTVMTAEAPPLA